MLLFCSSAPKIGGFQSNNDPDPLQISSSFFAAYKLSVSQGIFTHPNTKMVNPSASSVDQNEVLWLRKVVHDNYTLFHIILFKCQGRDIAFFREVSRAELPNLSPKLLVIALMKFSYGYDISNRIALQLFSEVKCSSKIIPLHSQPNSPSDILLMVRHLESTNCDYIKIQKTDRT